MREDTFYVDNNKLRRCKLFLRSPTCLQKHGIKYVITRIEKFAMIKITFICAVLKLSPCYWMQGVK